MNQTIHTSKAVERATGYSAVHIRNLVRKSVVTPLRDASNRFLYSDEDIERILAHRKQVEARRKR